MAGTDFRENRDWTGFPVEMEWMEYQAKMVCREKMEFLELMEPTVSQNCPFDVMS